MSYAKREDVTVATSTGGAATEYSSVLNGKVAAIVYASGGASGYASTVDFTITAETTGQNLWTEANITAGQSVYPVVAANTQDGAASTITEKEIALADERVKIVLAQGGNTKTGTFTVIMT